MQPDIRLPKKPAVQKYRAIMSQSGTNAPSPTIFENTIGEITWTRTIEGSYIGTITEPKYEDTIMTALNTSVMYVNTGANSGHVTGGRQSDTTVGLFTTNDAHTPTDGIMAGLTLEVTIYNNAENNAA